MVPAGGQPVLVAGLVKHIAALEAFPEPGQLSLPELLENSLVLLGACSSRQGYILAAKMLTAADKLEGKSPLPGFLANGLKFGVRLAQPLGLSSLAVEKKLVIVDGPGALRARST